jgi:amino acid transporter
VVGRPGPSLRSGQLAFARTIALSIGIQGPVAGVIVGPAVLAGIVGGSGALAYLLGLVAMSFVAYAFVIFSRALSSAGSVYAFNGASLGPAYGFVSAWILLLVYVSFAGGVYASTADIAQSLFASFGIHAWWVWFALGGFVLTMAFAYLSIGVSAIVILTCEGIAVLLLAVVGVVVLYKGGGSGGHSSVSAAPFELHGVHVGVLGLGVVNAFGAFSGFEGAATLGEESRRPTRAIPAAIAWSLVGAAVTYIVFTWIADNAYPTSAALAAAPAPFVHLATVDIGPVMGKAVNAAGVISAFGAQLACINAANRLVFALARDVGGTGRGRLLTRTDRRFASPVGALAVTGGVSLAALLAFSFEARAVRALTIIVEFGGCLIVVAYLLTVIAALAWVWCGDRRVFPLVTLTTGVAVLGYVLYDTFVPFPAAPFDWVFVAAAASVAVGAALAVVPGVHRQLRQSPLLHATRRPVTAAVDVGGAPRDEAG